MSEATQPPDPTANPESQTAPKGLGAGEPTQPTESPTESPTEPRTTVESFEIQEAAANQATEEAYDAADWMQPAAARWLSPPSSCLGRIYFKIGPRFWWLTTSIAMGVTVFGEEGHRGYSLICFGVNVFEIWDYFLHLSVANAIRTKRSFWVGRLSGTEAVNLNTWAIGKWLCVGTALMIVNLLIPAIYTWRQNENHSIAIVLLIAAGVKLAFLPVIVQPHIATTLMMELDVHHLSKWTEHLNVLSLPPYIILVGLIKEKWRIFLRYHFGLEIVPPLTFIFVMFLLLFGVHPRPEALMVVSAAPLSMAYLWLQVLPLASFNQMIVDWQHSTPSNDIFRILWQKEKELMFTVFRYRITFRKMRLSILSLALSMVIKQGRIVFTAMARAFDEADEPSLNVTTNLVFN